MTHFASLFPTLTLLICLSSLAVPVFFLGFRVFSYCTAKKSFIERFAKQSAPFFFMYLATIILLSQSFFLVQAFTLGLSPLLLSINSLAILLLCYFSYVCIYAWGHWKEKKGLHLIALACISLLVVLVMLPKYNTIFESYFSGIAINVKVLSIPGNLIELVQIMPFTILHAKISSLYLLNSLTTVCCLTALYLWSRRKIDDFGRDYYAFSYRLNAFLLLFFATINATVCLYFSLQGQHDLLGAAGLLLLSLLAMFTLLYSKNPRMWAGLLPFIAVIISSASFVQLNFYITRLFV